MFRIILFKESDRRAFFASSTRTTNAMNVIFHLIREIIIQDVYVFDIQATGGHVGGHQNGVFALFKSVENLFSLALIQVPVNGRNVTPFVI